MLSEKCFLQFDARIITMLCCNVMTSSEFVRPAEDALMPGF